MSGTSINLARFISCYLNSELTEQKWGITKGLFLGSFCFFEKLRVDHLWRQRGRRRRNMYSPQIYFIFFSFWAFSLLQHSTIAEPRNEIVRKGMWYIWTSMVGFISDTMSATSVFFLSDWLRSLANKNISIASFFSLRKLWKRIGSFFSFTCKTLWFIALSIYCPISFCVRHKFEIQISQVVVQGNMLKLGMVDELFIHLTLKLLQFIEKKIVLVNSGTGRIDQVFVFL